MSLLVVPPLSNYDPRISNQLKETYDVVTILQHAAYESTKNETYLQIMMTSKQEPGMEKIGEEKKMLMTPIPPMEHILDLIHHIPKKELKAIEKRMKPNKLHKILKREPIARELMLPKKAAQLMTIITNSSSSSRNRNNKNNRNNNNENNPPDEDEYQKVFLELEVMLGKSNKVFAVESSSHSNGNEKNSNNSDIEKLNTMLKVITHKIA